MPKPILQVGKRYYFIVHAYHHVVATLQAVTGKREGDLVDVVWIYSASQDWTAFFKKPNWSTVNHKFFPDCNTSWIAAFEFPHNIPDGK